MSFLFLSLPLVEYFGDDLALIHVHLRLADDLVILMALAAEDDHIARAVVFDRIGDGLAPVGAHDIGRVRLLEAGENVGNDRLRVFRARVVARDDDEIRLLTCDASHLRALAAVAVSAAAEEEHQPRGRKLAHRREDVVDGVGRDGVVDEDGIVPVGLERLGAPP